MVSSYGNGLLGYAEVFYVARIRQARMDSISVVFSDDLVVALC